MKSDWGTGKARKQMLKRARKIPDETIAQFLASTGTPLSDFYLEDCHEHTFVCSWHSQNGPMMMTFEDNALAFAVVQYLERQGVPRITNQAEWEQLARRNNWTHFTHQPPEPENAG